MQENHIQLIQNFYTGFQHGDFARMQKCYHPDIEFSDNVFPFLKGKQARAMWHMLVTGGKDAGLRISFSLDEKTGACTWEAFYRFSMTGRDVHNVIRASFEFKDGLIIRHTDRFDFWKWARMTFGSTGFFLGWTPFFKKKVRGTMAQRLKKFISAHAEYQS